MNKENINTVKDLLHGMFEVTYATDKVMHVPDDENNSHRVIIQEWLDEGNELTPYEE